MAFFHLILMALSIVSINANGLRDLDKRSGFLQWLRSLPYPVDVVCVQEAHCISVFECDSWFWSLAFCLLCPLVLINRVVVSFSIVLCCLL